MAVRGGWCGIPVQRSKQADGNPEYPGDVCMTSCSSCRSLLVSLLILGCLSRADMVSAQPGTWSSTGGPEAGNVSALAIDSQTPTTLYVGTYGGGVFVSADGGGNWSARNTGLTTLRVQAVAIDPVTPTTLYVGTFGGGVLFRSADGGASWSARNTGLGYFSVSAVAIDPLTPATLYAATYDGVSK